jgi:predicted ArsR family transcriptional regulator
MPAKRICDVLVLQALLAHGPSTAAQICQRADIQRAVVNEGLRHLRAARRVYVSGFDETLGQGRERPIYAVGVQPDAVFARKPDSEYSARYAARHAEEIRIRDRKRRNGWNKPLERRAP